MAPFVDRIVHPSSDLSRITDQVRSESKKTADQVERLTLEQNRKMEDIQTAIARLEASLAVLDVSWRVE